MRSARIHCRTRDTVCHQPGSFAFPGVPRPSHTRCSFCTPHMCSDRRRVGSCRGCGWLARSALCGWWSKSSRFSKLSPGDTHPGWQPSGNQFGAAVSRLPGVDNGILIGAPGQTVAGNAEAGVVAVLDPVPTQPHQLDQNTHEQPTQAQPGSHFRNTSEPLNHGLSATRRVCHGTFDERGRQPRQNGGCL